MNERQPAGSGPAGSGPAGSDKQTAVAAARMLLRSRRSAALATASASDDGWPFCSLVTIACDADGSPIMLFSRLADHTRNLDADSRAALLLEDAAGLANPQTGPRLTLTGRIIPDAEPRLRRRFLARHPGAALYADFGDFRFFRMEVDAGHWVGGFAQARRLERSLLLADAQASHAIAAAEPSAVDHMNADHAAAIGLWASRLLGLAGDGWRIVAIDPEGCDLGCGDVAFARLAFPRLATDAGDLRDILVALTAEARARPRPDAAG